MKLVPLGEQAVLAYLSDEAVAVRFAEAVRHANPDWLEDVVPAYASVGVFFDADRSDCRNVMSALELLAERMSVARETARTVLHRIPVCYERGLDLERVAELTNLTTDQVIQEHLSVAYTVFAVGFVPGFPYLGYLPSSISGVPRLDSPRLRVEAGSVGVAGKQTGLYPLARPGGWNLIGQTPLIVVDVAEGFFPIRVGDQVQFSRIDEQEYSRMVEDKSRLESDRLLVTS